MARFGGARRGGRGREWSKATDDTDIFPPVTDAPADDETPADDRADDEAGDPPDDPADAQDGPSVAPSDRLAVIRAWLTRREIPLRAKRFGRAVAVRWAQLSAAIVAGLAMCFSFPPYGWWYLAFVAFGLLAWVLRLPKTTRAGGFGYGFVFGLAFYLPLLPWISGLVGPIPWIGLGILEALFTALFGLAAVATRQVSGWPFWLAALWATQEWLKSTVPFGGFPWGVVAFGQADSPLLALAQFGGAPLVSFAVALVGFSLAAMTFEAVRWWRANNDKTVAPPAVLLPGVCISAVLLTTALAWPHVRQSGHGAGDDPAITVAAVQGNVPRLGLDFNAQRRAVLDNHVNETMQLANDVAAGRAPQPMVVVWPENSSDIDPLTNADARDEISTAAAAINAPILVGAVLAGPDYSPDNPVSTNSVIVWNPGSGPADRHDKQIIQPFGEYLPWRGFFRHLSSYADRAGYFVPGNGNGVVNAAGVPIGVTTCWEVIFDRAARASVQNGAELLAVPANNATFNQAMSEQQLAFARLRAVEHDRYVVVAGTTGISAIIAPDGGELARTDFFEPAYLDAQVRLKTQLTTATEWGPTIQGLLVLLGIAAVITAILHNKRFVRRLGRRSNDTGVAMTKEKHDHRSAPQ